MKYCVILTSDTGKICKVVGNSFVDIDIIVSNKRLAALTLREGENGPAVFNENDDDISSATGNGNKPQCPPHDWDTFGKCGDCGKWDVAGTRL